MYETVYAEHALALLNRDIPVVDLHELKFQNSHSETTDRLEARKSILPPVRLARSSLAAAITFAQYMSTDI